MKYAVLIFVLMSSIAVAQKEEKIKAYKTAYITEALDLTSQEAEKFWPIYNAHEDKLWEIRKQERKEFFEVLKGDFNSLSNKEADALLEKVLSFKEKEFLYEKELIQNLKGILPSKKILKLKRTEQEFKQYLLEHFKKRRGGRP